MKALEKSPKILIMGPSLTLSWIEYWAPGENPDEYESEGINDIESDSPKTGSDEVSNASYEVTR
jgi:hypothetical protein